ncbi:hypothetical protein QBC35DRAFT_453911 [Podospora australis]|uniref:Uncharacterized protein n=1 Tax=Podospora australis TaxID=1536484 RepID=A0AAN6WSS1_9PEZI|nr:hypothetical protein QBC35DRAFT_453911 [Podospora australis]
MSAPNNSFQALASQFTPGLQTGSFTAAADLSPEQRRLCDDLLLKLNEAFGVPGARAPSHMNQARSKSPSYSLLQATSTEQRTPTIAFQRFRLPSQEMLLEVLKNLLVADQKIC